MSTGILRRTHVIRSWAGWDHEVNEFVLEFRDRFSVSPNVLLANEVTFNRIDMAATEDNIVGDEGQHPEPGAYAPLEAFNGPDYSLMFAFDDTLPDLRVSLIYDPDPAGDGEPVPEEDTQLDVEGEATGPGGRG